MRFRRIILWTLTGLLLTSFLKAQYYFGRNKVQYNQFCWHILKTRHFDIYYYPEMESLAEIGAFYAEEAYEQLQDRLNHTLSGRIPLVFYSSHFHFEETNTFPYLIPQGLGGFFEFVKGRVVIPGDGSIPRFAHTIRHELVHVFQHSVEAGVVREHRQAHYAAVPLWFTEGLAEFWSDGWNEEADMIIRDGIIYQSLVPIRRLWMIQGTYLMYKEGQSVLKYISETYGDYKIRQILENCWREESFDKVIRLTLGTDLKTLDEAWMYHLKKEVYPQMEDADLPGMVSRRITDSGFNTLPCFFRMDTVRTVLFVANRDGYTSIYQKRLSDAPKKGADLLIRGEKTPEIEALHLQRSRMDCRNDGLLVFSAKSGPRDVLNTYDIYRGSIVHKFQDSSLVTIMSPVWSPDGRTIAFCGLDPAGRQDIYVLDTGTGMASRLTCDYYDDHDPSWSPDGQFLVFASNRTRQGESGFTNLFMIDTRSGRLVQATHGLCHDVHPVWSPDGQWIAFSSDRGGASNLWLLPVDPDMLSGLSHEVPDTPRMRQVTRLITGAFYPCWTDSATLLYSAFENSGFQIREQTDLSQCGPEAPPEMSRFQEAEETWYYPWITGANRLSAVQYRRKYSLDFAQSQVIQDPIYGTSGGGQVGISDMLGNEQYFFLLYNNARTQSEFWDGFNLAATRVDLSGRVNHAVGLYRLAGLYYNGYEGYFYERRYGGFGSVSYPFNKFERVESNLNIRKSEKDRIGDQAPREALLVSNFLSVVRDNSLWGPTGPLDGSRIRITVGNTVDIQHANVNFTTLIVDLRHYFRLGTRMCHAVRVLGQFNQGKEEMPFTMGGSWDLRGYRLWSLWGPKLILMTHEFRFPFIDHFYLGFPFGGIGFSAVRGALFVDAGNAWDHRFGDWKGSCGFGIRFSLGGYLVLRLDTGWKTNFKESDSQTFTQFFFGWDF